MELLTHPSLVLGALGEPVLPAPLQPDTRFDFRGSLPLAMAMGISLFAILVWVTVFRKPVRRKERGQLLDRSSHSGSEPASSRGTRRRRRRRRHGHRPTAPTLSETGGLPQRGAGESNPPPS